MPMKQSSKHWKKRRKNKLMFREANLVWTAPDDCGKDIYRIFRKHFLVSDLKNRSYVLELSVDSYFEVFVNGLRVRITAFSDHPHNRTYSHADITEYLKTGENLLAVRVHYAGEDFSTYKTGKPYLRCSLYTGNECIAKSDSSWKCAVDPEYCSGKQVVRTVQMGYCFECHAQPIQWYDISFDDSKWQNAQCNSPEEEEYWISFSKRPIKELQEIDFVPGKLIKQCFLQRTLQDGTAAECCEQDIISGECDGSNGHYYLFDLGAEYVGYLKFKLQSDAGTVVDIAHGEHI